MIPQFLLSASIGYHKSINKNLAVIVQVPFYVEIAYIMIAQSSVPLARNMRDCSCQKIVRQYAKQGNGSNGHLTTTRRYSLSTQNSPLHPSLSFSTHPYHALPTPPLSAHPNLTLPTPTTLSPSLPHPADPAHFPYNLFMFTVVLYPSLPLSYNHYSSVLIPTATLQSTTHPTSLYAIPTHSTHLYHSLQNPTISYPSPPSQPRFPSPPLSPIPTALYSFRSQLLVRNIFCASPQLFTHPHRTLPDPTALCLSSFFSANFQSSSPISPTTLTTAPPFPLHSIHPTACHRGFKLIFSSPSSYDHPSPHRRSSFQNHR